MFATKGWMKATLFVVGILVVGFGLYVVFQVHDAQSDWQPGSPHWKHNTLIRTFTTEWYVGTRFRFVNKPCPYCGKLRLYTKYERVYNYYDRSYIYRLSWDHKKLEYLYYLQSETKERIEPISTSSMCYNPDCPDHGGG